MAKKYRKKPVEIEAMQFDGTNYEEIAAWCRDFDWVNVAATVNPPQIIIFTLEGEMTAGLMWWIIKGVKGEFYPCRPDIFEATYEAVEE